MEEKKSSKERIMDSATKLFARKGFDAVSIREICKDADVNLCMISYWFGSKQELYNKIIYDLIEKQTQYADRFFDITIDPKTLPKEQQIDILLRMLDKFVDFFYSNISNDLIVLLLKDQQSSEAKFRSPVFEYLRAVIASVFDREKDDREVIFRTLFIISQVNSPKILPAFSLRLLMQDEFTQEDIAIIKNNIKWYINMVLKEEGII